MTGQMSDSTWKRLIGHINAGDCTPFVGAGALQPNFPTGRDLAQELAGAHNVPLPDTSNLAQVCQAITVQDDSRTTKRAVTETIKRYAEAVGTTLPHAIEALAEMPFPLYMTTNYDDMLERALSANRKKAGVAICPWNTELAEMSLDELTELLIDPVKAADISSRKSDKPTVYHVHGHMNVPHSILVSEDDYLDFMINFSRNDQSIQSPMVQRAMARSAMLFVGYALEDINFRVLLRSFLTLQQGSSRARGVTVQFDPDGASVPEKTKEYLEAYFARLELDVFWGTAQSFMDELYDRWKALR